MVSLHDTFEEILNVMLCYFSLNIRLLQRYRHYRCTFDKRKYDCNIFFIFCCDVAHIFFLMYVFVGFVCSGVGETNCVVGLKWQTTSGGRTGRDKLADELAGNFSPVLLCQLLKQNWFRSFSTIPAGPLSLSIYL